MENILHPCLGAAWRVHLWALDEIAPELATWTRGVGPGAKFSIYNELLQRFAGPNMPTLVFSDDDYTFKGGDLVRLVELMHITGLDLAQPAHATGRNAIHNVTFRQRRYLARLTNFVEIGPVFAVSRNIYGKILPFPEDAGMGWGLEFLWAQLAHDGTRLGVIDAVSLDHLVPPGLTYDGADAWWEMDAMLRRRGVPLTDWRGSDAAVWPVWRPFAPKAWREARPAIPEYVRRPPPADL